MRNPPGSLLISNVFLKKGGDESGGKNNCDQNLKQTGSAAVGGTAAHLRYPRLEYNP